MLAQIDIVTRILVFLVPRILIFFQVFLKKYISMSPDLMTAQKSIFFSL